MAFGPSSAESFKDSTEETARFAAEAQSARRLKALIGQCQWTVPVDSVSADEYHRFSVFKVNRPRRLRPKYLQQVGIAAAVQYQKLRAVLVEYLWPILVHTSSLGDSMMLQHGMSPCHLVTCHAFEKLNVFRPSLDNLNNWLPVTLETASSLLM